MIYKEFKGLKLSALGMGCMRFPCVEGDNARVDMDAVRELVAYAKGNGINYFDTAWVYHAGTSESVIGEVLSEYPRESFYLATKFPGFDNSYMEKKEEIFETQLRRCKTDYFDFYLFHNVTEKNIDAFTDERYGVFDYLINQKKMGKIRHLGFSTHGSLATIKRFLDTYGSELEFCQLQINWLDWKLQNAKEKVALVASYGLPVWVMEPVRGGRIATLAPDEESRLRELRKNATVPEWAFRFIQSIPEVTVTLSGMSSLEQLRENVATFSTSQPLNERELEVLFKISDEIIERSAVPCTACRYCTDACPSGLDIPELIKRYNDSAHFGKASIPASALDGIDEGRRPDACLGCTQCESLCPQGIKISSVMRDFAKKLKL
ncbi:MAG: aldo/keto reductase [Clostridia bacterium]|nr:aldo/keto reductase [Clostridia bacterium]